MISECFNPSCQTKLNYLRGGRVVRLLHNEERGVRIEHFWLCANCYRAYDFRFKQDGSVSIVKQHCAERLEEELHPELRWIEEELAS
jgi:hypothetical protein